MTDSSYFSYGNIKLGKGSFDIPPILIGTIFYQNETIVDRRNPEVFNVQKAKKRINTHISLSEKYNIPSLIEISATTPNSMIKYLEFYLDHFTPPFVLGGNLESRIAGIEYLTRKVKGRGGVIVIDGTGRCSRGFTTKKMIHGWIEHGGEVNVSF